MAIETVILLELMLYESIGVPALRLEAFVVDEMLEHVVYFIRIIQVGIVCYSDVFIYCILRVYVVESGAGEYRAVFGPVRYFGVRG